MGFNDNPIILNKGSAIFIHISFENLRSTAGCIALSKEYLIDLLRSIKKNTIIHII